MLNWETNDPNMLWNNFRTTFNYVADIHVPIQSRKGFAKQRNVKDLQCMMLFALYKVKIFRFILNLWHWPLNGKNTVRRTQGRINHIAEAAYAAGPALLAILGAPALFPKKVVQ